MSNFKGSYESSFQVDVRSSAAVNVIAASGILVMSLLGPVENTVYEPGQSVIYEEVLLAEVMSEPGAKLTAKIVSGRDTDGDRLVLVADVDRELLDGSLVIEDGAEGPQVSALQLAAISLGCAPGLIKDGDFGSNTQVAITSLQEKAGISPADGRADAATQQKIVEGLDAGISDCWKDKEPVEDPKSDKWLGDMVLIDAVCTEADSIEFTQYDVYGRLVAEGTHDVEAANGVCDNGKLNTKSGNPLNPNEEV